MDNINETNHYDEELEQDVRATAIALNIDRFIAKEDLKQFGMRTGEIMSAVRKRLLEVGLVIGPENPKLEVISPYYIAEVDISDVSRSPKYTAQNINTAEPESLAHAKDKKSVTDFYRKTQSNFGLQKAYSLNNSSWLSQTTAWALLINPLLDALERSGREHLPSYKNYPRLKRSEFEEIIRSRLIGGKREAAQITTELINRRALVELKQKGSKDIELAAGPFLYSDRSAIPNRTETLMQIVSKYLSHLNPTQ